MFFNGSQPQEGKMEQGPEQNKLNAFNFRPNTTVFLLKRGTQKIRLKSSAWSGKGKNSDDLKNLLMEKRPALTYNILT